MTGIPLFDEYNVYPGTWDEMCLDKNIRSQYDQVFDDISQLPADMLQQKDKLAGELFMNQGITLPFTVMMPVLKKYSLLILFPAY